MNRISPDDKPKAPRLRPFGKSPLKSTGRIIKSQVGGKEEGANSDDRSTTGSPGLNENLGKLIQPDQPDVTAPPDSTSPLKKRVLSRSNSKRPKTPGSHRPKTASAIGYGYPSTSAISTANEGTNTQQRQQNDDRSVNHGTFMIRGPRIVQKTDGKDQAKTYERKKGLLEKDSIGNGLMKRPHGTGSSVKTTPISSKKDEIKEEGSSKEAAKMLNRAIDLSDVTKAGAPDQSLSFSCRPERYDINTMTVERGKAFTPAHEGEAKKIEDMEEHKLEHFEEQQCFEYDKFSKVVDTDKARHLLSAKRTEEHGTNEDHGNIRTKDSQRAKLEADHAQGRDKVRGRHKKSVSESTKPKGKMDTIFKDAFTNLDGYPIAYPNKNMPEALQMAASKRKHTGRSPEKNASLEERRCETALPESDDQMKGGKRVFPNHLEHPRSESKSMTKNHEDDSTGPTRLERFPSSIPAQSKARKQKANVYGSAVCNRNNGTLRHLQQGDFRHSSVGKSKIYSRRSNTEVKSSRNKRNGHTSKGSFRIIDKFGTAICILSCISDIENLDEMIEHKTCGLDDETIWYLTSKVKLKVRETINYIKTRD